MSVVGGVVGDLLGSGKLGWRNGPAMAPVHFSCAWMDTGSVKAARSEARWREEQIMLVMVKRVTRSGSDGSESVV